ncbi:nuclear transport factor 2 family protein [Olivibacter domesticus]|uniref:SnoaL-like domain-containing protein n=1 Tax=Olivibacter domesticus TaxID=407022 RepID=A0A1H7KC12_OLID1|nr:nuclear transport factor 2 family protein [Olivibacter domesticus]SEK84349.1 SnoaL-like domain-containing protein [Olivibacter domesticus]
MDINLFIQEFITISNAYDTKNYLDKWHTNAVLDDPSVGQVFKGHAGIEKYFESYFIGYKTQSRLIRLAIISDNEAHIEVAFTGDFPEGKIDGVFDFIFSDGKIAAAKADLIR